MLTLRSDKSSRNRNIGTFFVDTLQRLIFYQLVKFSKFDVGSAILFQIKVFARNIKETTLGRCFIKVTACPSSM